MARTRRDTAAGIFHVYTHSVWAAELFRDDADRATSLRELARAGAKAGWTCLAYCLLDTHYHLILEVEDGMLPRGMHSLNFRFAIGFNRRYGSKGHVHGARYDNVRIADERHLLRCFRYIVRNPVEAGLCERPQDWPWSSYAATIGPAESAPFVASDRILGPLGRSREGAIAALRRFVEES